MTVLQVPQVKFGNDTSICAGNSLLLQATSTGATAQWSTNLNQAFLSVNLGGKYWATSKNGSCISSDTIVVGIDTLPRVTLGSQTSVCGANNLILDPGAIAQSYKWQKQFHQSNGYCKKLRVVCSKRD